LDKKSRFWEIDTLRGIAIIMMIIYHIIFDLYFFDFLDISIKAPFLQLFQRPIGIIFILLVGISLTLSYSKAKKDLDEKQIFKKFLKRGLKIVILGLFITLITWIFLEKGFIIFGVLHCIGISIILGYKFLNYRIANLIIGIILIIIGILLRTLAFDFKYLLWLGFIPKEFYTVDYFPLLPWFGVVLLGIFIGNTLYPYHNRIFRLADMSKYKIIKFLSYLGKHSLIIYFVHQVIIICLILLFKNLVF
jgi:uncharacterized membrane protein